MSSQSVPPHMLEFAQQLMYQGMVEPSLIEVLQEKSLLSEFERYLDLESGSWEQLQQEFRKHFCTHASEGVPRQSTLHRTLNLMASLGSITDALYLIEHRGAIGFGFALNAAAMAGQLDMIKLLLTFEDYPNHGLYMVYAAARGHTEVVEYLRGFVSPKSGYIREAADAAAWWAKRQTEI